MLRNYLAPNLRKILEHLDFSEVEEVRLRLNRPLMIKTRWGCYSLSPLGAYCSCSEAYLVSRDDLDRTLQLITQSSWYAWEQQIQGGYLTLPGGHRVGLSGQAVFANGSLKTIKNISSLNFRQAKAVPGAADSLVSQVISKRTPGVISTLIVSPPGCGKTTLLRDLARQVANEGFQVTVIDERSEIAASYLGVPQLDVGFQTDVLDGYDKVTGVYHALRGLSPDVVFTDEIGHEQDAWILGELARSGVKVVATCHGNSLEQIKTKTWAKMSLEVFELMVILSRRRGPGTVEAVLSLRAKS